MNPDPAISPEQRAVAIGEIILLTRQLEGALRNLTGPTEVAGLHALTELLGSRLPEQCRRELHYAATIRNRAAHEEEFMISIGELEHFKSTAGNLLNTLNALAAAAQNSTPPPAAAEDSVPTENTLDVAVEKELFAKLSQKAAKLGYFPVAGNIYLLYILLYTIFVQGHLVILTALYFCAGVLGTKGWFSDQDRGLLYVAAAALLFTYITTAILSFAAPVKKLPRFIGLLPGFNVIYLLSRFLIKLKWGRFAASLIGLGFTAAAIWLFCQKYVLYGALAVAANWVVSIVAAVIWGKKREE